MSLVVVPVLQRWLTAAAFVIVTLVVAAATCARRIGTSRLVGWAGAAIVAGVGPAFGIVLGSGSVPSSPIAVVPVADILIGGAMTATSLAGVRTVQTLRERRGGVEAALAIGLGRRAAGAVQLLVLVGLHAAETITTIASWSSWPVAGAPPGAQPESRVSS